MGHAAGCATCSPACGNGARFMHALRPNHCGGAPGPPYPVYVQATTQYPGRVHRPKRRANSARYSQCQAPDRGQGDGCDRADEGAQVERGARQWSGVRVGSGLGAPRTCLGPVPPASFHTLPNGRSRSARTVLYVFLPPIKVLPLAEYGARPLECEAACIATHMAHRAPDVRLGSLASSSLSFRTLAGPFPSSSTLGSGRRS